MSVARITEISATSDESFEDATSQGIRHDTIVSYQVNMLVTFVLE